MGGARPGGGRPKGSKDKKKQRPTIKTKKTKAKKAKPKKTAPPAEPVKPEEKTYPSFRTAPEVKLTPYPNVGDDVDKYGPRDTEFEKKIKAHLRDKPEQVKAKPELPIIQEQGEFEIKIIADFLKLPFALWASRINYPPIRLTNQEAIEWAEPTKVLLDHYMPKIPAIGYAWFAWSITTISIINTRVELITAEKRQRGESAETKPGPVVKPVQGAKGHKPVTI
jgi:hypothetical protein